MNPSTRILSASAMLGVALAACTASAQITLVSQTRGVSLNACTPPQSQGQSASNFDLFDGGVLITNCPAGPFGFASAFQTSTLSASAFTCTQTATSVGNAGSDNRFQVVFDVTEPTNFSITGRTNRAILSVTLAGPGGNVFSPISNTTRTEAGTLLPGRYTLTSNFSGDGNRAEASINATFSLPPYRIPWSTQDCGGGDLSGGAFGLKGTIGQTDAAIPILTGGEFRITLGYWARDPGPVPCVADFDDGSSTGQPDGGVTLDDLLYYLDLFRDGSATADVDDGSFSGVTDGGVTIDDLLYFLNRFAQGC